jgi:uncharacterized protein YjbI with pentapeptide repeats
MANEEHVAMLKRGVAAWNEWRRENPDIRPDLSEADLRKASLSEAALDEVNLSGADLSEGNLIMANLDRANLSKANLSGADLYEAHVHKANLNGANLSRAALRRANLIMANLDRANLGEADLREASLNEAALNEVNLSGADLSEANLSRAVLIGAECSSETDFSGARLVYANFSGVNLNGVHFIAANLNGANLSKAHLIKVNFYAADLLQALLTGADLRGANLQAARLMNTDLTDADLTGCRVFGISAWRLKLEGAKQQNLVITDTDEPTVTVDNIEVAQVVYLLLHNEKIRDVIDTIGKKGVLLLGRFTEGRMVVLERLREKLRDLGFVPMVFNFDKPETKDFTETVRLLCNLSHFVIVDITNPRSAPLELQATVPDYMVPFAPILQQGEEPFSMFVDLQNKHDWVLDVVRYSSVDRLIEVLEDEIVRPAETKFNELLSRRTNQLRVKNV